MLRLKVATLLFITVSFESMTLSLSLPGERLLLTSSRTLVRRKMYSSSILFYSRYDSIVYSLKNTRCTTYQIKPYKWVCYRRMSSINSGESTCQLISHSCMGLSPPFWRRERICSLVLRQADTLQILVFRSYSLGEVRRCSRLISSYSTAEWQV